MQVSFDFGEISPKIPEFSATDVLIDRGSRYSYAFARIDSPEEAMKFMKSLRTKKPFQNADHNSYAYRFRTEEGIIIE
jgi:putative IMPACT (imprinted ancient) family translation regulator